MNLYFLFCLLVIAIAGIVLWLMRPRRCTECGGTGQIVCHDGADHYYAPCYKCKGAGWKS